MATSEWQPPPAQSKTTHSYNTVLSPYIKVTYPTSIQVILNPFAPGDFAKKRVLKLVKLFSGHYRAIKSQNLPQTGLQVVHFVAF